MTGIEEILSDISAFLWGPWLIVALIGMGVYFTIGTKFLQIRKFGYIMKDTIGRAFKKGEVYEGEGTLTPFQSVMTALSSTVGVGSIVGVATALSFGGPGAIFWMWVSAIFGMCTKYAEITLSIAYREKTDEGYFVGGPAYYLRKGLKSKFVATWFSWSLIFATLAGCLIHSNALTANIANYVPLSTSIIGISCMILVGLVSLGGITRIGSVTEKLVPAKVIIYFTGGMIVILCNITHVPEAISLILQGAFSPIAAGGGVGGYAVAEAIRLGITRGLFSNEAGQGTAPIAHATAKTTHPARQGLWGVIEVFIVLVVCTITALAILTTGVLGAGYSPNLLASEAFRTVHPLFGYVVSISIVLCAFSTLIGICYYGESTVTALKGSKFGKVYRIIFIGFISVGSMSTLTAVWTVGEIAMALCVIGNIIGLAKLSPQIFKLTNEYFDNIDAEKIAIRDTTVAKKG